MKYKISLSIVIVSFLALSCYFFAWSQAELTSESSLPSLSWTAAPNVIAVSDISREENDGLMLIRLSDGIEQFIAGDLETSFTDPDNLYIFGDFAEGYTDQNGELVFFIENAMNIKDAILSASSGITSIVASTSKKNVLIEMKKDSETTNYCIAYEDLEDGCYFINVRGTTSETLWHPNEEIEMLIIRQGDGSIFTYDFTNNPDDAEIERIRLEDDPKKYIELDALFEEESTQEENTMFSLLNILVTFTDDGISYHRIPFFSKVKWLSDGEHVLISSKDKLYVLEIGTNKLALIFEEKGVGDKDIYFQN